MPDADDAREGIHEPGRAEGASDAVMAELAAAVVARFPGVVFHESHGQPVVYVDRASWHDVAVHLRDVEQCTSCLDVTVVDHLSDAGRLVVDGVAPERFEVVANYLSHARNRRLRVICEVPEHEPAISSLSDVYPGTNFAEREAYDLFGITFEGHSDLTRILMPDDWVGHPLRKDDHPSRVPVTFKEDPTPR